MKNQNTAKQTVAAAFALLLLSAPTASLKAQDANAFNIPGLGQVSDESPEWNAVVSDSPWVNAQGQLTDNVQQLIDQVQNSVFHGLNPENYNLNALVEQQQALKSRTLSLVERQQLIAKFETLLDGAYFELASHLGSSLVEGRDIQDYVFMTSPKPELGELYQRAADGEWSVDALFTSIAPTHSSYERLQNALTDLLHEKQTGLGRTSVAFERVVAPGEEHESVRAAKLRLLETGDFSGSSGVNNTLDEEFKEAVAQFQARHHLDATGELNEHTVAAMNRTVYDDIESVVVSLERWRWMPRDLGEKRVVTNVPDFRLRLYDGEETVTDMAVVVGKTKHRTPLFSESIKHVVAAPTWTVPASIANKELVPLEREKPGYLERNNYELLAWKDNKAVVVPFDELPADTFYRDKLRYTIRQKSGPKNALGAVKILMPNEYAIYYHDTQAKSLFSKDQRAYSHGCVRLHEPQKMASLLMQLDGVDPARSEHFLASKKTSWYNLDNPIESHIVYFTTFTDENGRLQFRNDVYSYDENITQALQHNSLLSIISEDAGSTLLADIDSLNI